MFFYYSNCKNTIFFLNRFFFCLFYVFLEFNKYDGPMMDGFFFAFFVIVLSVAIMAGVIIGHGKMDVRSCFDV